MNSKKEIILKRIIKQLIREQLGYPDPGGVLLQKQSDEEYKIQNLNDNGEWIDGDIYPTFESANIELMKVCNLGIPTSYRIVGTKSNEVYTTREILAESINGKTLLNELLNYNQLISATRNGWLTRFKTVRNVKAVPPTYELTKDKKIKLSFEYYSNPSTTGMTHAGSIIFSPNASIWNKIKDWWTGLVSKLKSFIGKKVPPKIISARDLKKMNCSVSCSCPDFKYRFEVANYKQNAANIVHSNGNEPVIRNPRKLPGLCKHLLATLNYLSDAEEIQIPDELKKK